MFLHTQEGSGEVQPRVLYWASMLLKQVWPHAGSSATDEGAEAWVVTVAVADAQYAVSNAITVLATAVPQAPLAQS